MSIGNLNDYDVFLVTFSGGKDSLACILNLLDLGVPRERIMLWHHVVDGMEGSTLMDWPCTHGYCRAVGEALGIPLYYNWRMGGFEGEMNKENAKSAPVKFEQVDGTIGQAGGIKCKEGTRLKFPQVTADLSVRWCSAYLKIDVASLSMNNQDWFLGKQVLFQTGERAEESSARAKYKQFEGHKCSSKKRIVHHWRPVHHWPEARIWEIIEKHNINPHPAYKLGWGRVSCIACIFGSPNQWASVQKISPNQFDTIAEYERKFERTIHRKESVIERAAKGKPYEMKERDILSAMSTVYTEDVIQKEWRLPAGAFGESTGPT